MSICAFIIRRKIFGCPDTRVGCVFTNADTDACHELGAAETIYLGEFYDLTIGTGILLFEAVDLDFHEFDIDAVDLCFETRDFDRQ